MSWGKGCCFEYELFHLGILALTGTPLSTVINIMNWICFDKTHSGVVTRHFMHPCNISIYCNGFRLSCVVNSSLRKITFECCAAVYLKRPYHRKQHFHCTWIKRPQWCTLPFTMHDFFPQPTQLLYVFKRFYCYDVSSHVHTEIDHVYDMYLVSGKLAIPNWCNFTYKHNKYR